MYLHIGSDVAIKISDIIGIFDMDNTTVSAKTRAFLKKAQKSGEIADVTEDLPKSFILTKTANKNRVYISSLATRTLLKRCKTENFI
ncbi:MAG: DUF370 domain-containing protein [Firmicutes bacterium]|nr:DUF370 domain-containing protein [Bacillota bacterium]HAL63659.1 DUF370 domain-containing protein [Clostridiales bacterium]